MFGFLLLSLLQTPAATAPWAQGLALSGGGAWQRRVPVVVANAGDSALAGRQVAIPVGSGPGEIPLPGITNDLRVTDAQGREMLYGAGTKVLRIPVECAARGSATYYVYFGNPSAWRVPDYLETSGEFVNGGVEEGSGGTPVGWRHDEGDARHRAEWVADVAHGGTHSLRTRVSEGAEATWISTRQSGIPLTGGARYVLTAWVKSSGVVGQAGWYIHVGNEKEPMLASPMLLDQGGTHDWQQVRAEFTAPPAADRADLGTVLRGTGTAWFDDASLECLDPQAGPAVQVFGVQENPAGAELARPAPWPMRGRWTHRARVTVRNYADQSESGALVAVSLPAVLRNHQGRVAPEDIQVVSPQGVVESHRLGDTLLFRGGAPANGAATYLIYFRDGGVPSAARATRTATAAYAANPALPGGENARYTSARLKDYAALLNSPLNLARNGSFEEGGALPDGWEGGSEGAHPAGTEMGLMAGGLFGKRCARMVVPATSTPSWTGWRQDVPVMPGHTYLYAAWLKCRNLQGGLQIHVHLLTASGALVKENAMTGAGPAIDGTRDWTLLSGTFTTPADCERFQMHLTMNATGTAWHDGVVLTETIPGDVAAVEAVPAPSGGALKAWPVNAVVKVFPEDLPPAAAAPARISCARNEHEPLQIAFRSGRALEEVAAVPGPLSGPGGSRLPAPQVNVVGYVPVDYVTNYYSNTTPEYYRKSPTGQGGSDGWAGWWPDPLLPARFTLQGARTQAVWLTVYAPRTARPGDYRGTLRLMQAGRAVAAVPYTVHVYGFTLPEKRSLKAVYDVRQSGEMWQLPGKSPEETRIAFWRFMAERRLCPDRIQPDPVFTYRDGKVTADFAAYDRAAKLYFDELKFPHSYAPSQFYLFGWGHLPADRFGEQPYAGVYPYEGVDRSHLRPEYVRAYQACLKAYWDHVKQMGWADRITLYISDEPYDNEKPVRDQMKALCKMIQGVDPRIPIYSSTWHHQPEWDGYINVWGFGHYGIVPVSKMRDVQRAGATVWWTTDGQMCTDTPYCAIERLLPHYCFKYGAKAYEFWGIDWLTYDPYRYGWHRFLLHDFGPDQQKQYVRYPNGDGFLAYPPAPLKLDHALSSIRLEQAREGEEDYEYLALLRGLVARGKGAPAAEGRRALALADRLVTSPCEIGRYSTRILPDPDQVLRVRAAVAAAIERLGGGR